MHTKNGAHLISVVVLEKAALLHSLEVVMEGATIILLDTCCDLASIPGLSSYSSGEASCDHELMVLCLVIVGTCITININEL